MDIAKGSLPLGFRQSAGATFRDDQDAVSQCDGPVVYRRLEEPCDLMVLKSSIAEGADVSSVANEC